MKIWFVPLRPSAEMPSAERPSAFKPSAVMPISSTLYRILSTFPYTSNFTRFNLRPYFVTMQKFEGVMKYKKVHVLV